MVDQTCSEVTTIELKFLEVLFPTRVRRIGHRHTRRPPFLRCSTDRLSAWKIRTCATRSVRKYSEDIRTWIGVVERNESGVVTVVLRQPFEGANVRKFSGLRRHAARIRYSPGR